jgi:hypothetical protein
VKRTLLKGPSAALPAAVATKKTKEKADVLIWNDGCITISELFTVKGMEKRQVCPSPENLAIEKYAQSEYRNSHR